MGLVKIEFNRDGLSATQKKVIDNYEAIFDMISSTYEEVDNKFIPATQDAAKVIRETDTNNATDVKALEKWARLNGILPSSYQEGTASADAVIEKIYGAVANEVRNTNEKLRVELSHTAVDAITNVMISLYKDLDHHTIRSTLISLHGLCHAIDSKYIIYAKTCTSSIQVYAVVSGAIPAHIIDPGHIHVIPLSDMAEIFHIVGTTEDVFYADPVKNCIESDQDYVQPYLILRPDDSTDTADIYKEIRYCEQPYSTIYYGPLYVSRDNAVTDENYSEKIDVPCCHGPASVPVDITCGDESHPFWIPSGKENTDIIHMPPGYGIASVQIKEYYHRGRMTEVKYRLVDQFDDGKYKLIYTPTATNVDISIVAMKLLSIDLYDTTEFGTNFEWVSTINGGDISNYLYYNMKYDGDYMWASIYLRHTKSLGELSTNGFTVDLNKDTLDIYRGTCEDNTFTWKKADPTVTSVQVVDGRMILVTKTDDFDESECILYRVRFGAGAISLVDRVTHRSYPCTSQEICIVSPAMVNETDGAMQSDPCSRLLYSVKVRELQNHMEWFTRTPKHQMINIDNCKADGVTMFDLFDDAPGSIHVTKRGEITDTVGIIIPTKIDLTQVKNSDLGKVTVLLQDGSKTIPLPIFCIDVKSSQIEIRVTGIPENKNGQMIMVIFPQGIVHDTIVGGKKYVSNQQMFQLIYAGNDYVVSSSQCGCCDTPKKDNTMHSIDLSNMDGSYTLKLILHTMKREWLANCKLVIHGYEHREFRLRPVTPKNFRVVDPDTNTVVGTCEKLYNAQIYPMSNFTAMYDSCDGRDTHILEFDLKISLDRPTTASPVIYFDLGSDPSTGISQLLISDATKPSGWTEVPAQTITFKHPAGR